MAFILLGIVAGFGVPFQTTVNSKLRTYVKSPFVTSGISFCVGLIALILFSLVTRTPILLTSHQLGIVPWWAYFGGVIGVIGLTANILLFPILGSVQTVTMPILGQIVMSMLIDNFGWLGTKRNPLTAINLVGVLILIAGVIAVVVLPSLLDENRQEKPSKKSATVKLIAQIGGVIAGMLLAAQAAINGHFGSLLNSPLHAAVITMVVGIILLFIVSLFQHPIEHLKETIQDKKPWWVWVGGLFGASYTFLNSFLVPKLGTGTVVVLVLLGQLLSSLIIDHFGLLGAKKTKITWVQVAGLVAMIVGIALIKLMK